MISVKLLLDSLKIEMSSLGLIEVCCLWLVLAKTLFSKLEFINMPDPYWVAHSAIISVRTVLLKMGPNLYLN